MEKVKLIRGNSNRAEEIRKTIEEWGGLKEYNFSFKHEDTYYYVDQLSICNCIDEEIAKELISEGKAEIYELPALNPKCEFKPFDKVLVRNFEYNRWVNDFFSFKKVNDYVCVGGTWTYCIKYEGNEALLGATYNPE